MTDDKPFKYADPEPPIPEQPARDMVAEIEENGPMKPWTLISRVEAEDEDINVRLDVLKPLALRGILTTTADGDIRIYKKDRLEKEVSK